jgi:8-oxo-dGTP diphosphatase
MTDSLPRQIRAAGGLVWRRIEPVVETGEPELPSAIKDLEFALVHRPRYQDWSLPKGKAKKRESAEATALREVQEETGLECELGEELLTIHYLTPRGDEKTVRFWSMRVKTDHGFEPNDEVDQLRWVAFDDLPTLCTFSSDLEVVHSMSISGR